MIARQYKRAISRKIGVRSNNFTDFAIAIAANFENRLIRHRFDQRTLAFAGKADRAFYHQPQREYCEYRTHHQ